MRTWIISDHVDPGRPQAWIIPHPAWATASRALWGEPARLANVPEGSHVMVVHGEDTMVVVNAPPARQLRRKAYVEAARSLLKLGASGLGLWLGGLDSAHWPSVVFGVEHGLYRYREPDPALPMVTVVVDPPQRERVELLARIAVAQSWTRDGVNMPPNEKPPERLAARYQAGAPPAVQFRVYSRDDLAAMEAGGILAVGAGSARPPVLLAGRYQGNGSGPWLALVGKGITFDSGGISLKPREGLGRLKGDMAGSAAVMAALRVVAEQGWPLNVMAWAPLAENLPDGQAYRPGDVLTMLDKTRVEVISTDAEGRLVLADAVTMAVREGAAGVVDMATLTGSNVVTLGAIRAALITNDGHLARLVTNAGDSMEEPVWEMPHDVEYAHLNHSRIADLKNSGGRPAGTISAGLFIGHFAGGVPWAHLDIAGLAFDGTDTGLGATGYGVAMLVELCRQWAATHAQA
ncbi:MAG: leucyl aminopeptidase family protein [Thermaerobacter sp.]|nr:leucyl aminopeptidase family protein [Thermaerobacter sp.]